MENQNLPLTLDELRKQFQYGVVPIGTPYHYKNGWIMQYGNLEVLTKNGITIEMTDKSHGKFLHEYVTRVTGVNSPKEATQAFFDYCGYIRLFALNNGAYENSSGVVDSSGD